MNNKSEFDDFVTIEKDDLDNNNNIFSDNFLLDDQDDYLSSFITISNPKVDLVKSSAVFDPKSDFSILSSIKSLASSLYYNHFNLSDKFDLDDPTQLNNNKCLIFDESLSHNSLGQKQGTLSRIKTALKRVLYITYRNEFNNLTDSLGKEMSITTDCGWGCMLRACQMMLSKGIIERKIYKYIKNNETPIGGMDEVIEKIRKETALLFFDNNLPIEKVVNNHDFKFFWQKYVGLIEKEEDQKEKERKNALKWVTPPYSIQTLCKVANCAGKWTSDYYMIKAFIEINEQLFNNTDGMVYLEAGNIKEEMLYKTFCEELKCTCDNNFTLLNSENSICEECFQKYIQKNNRKMKRPELFKNNTKSYVFSKGGIIFISFRLGLQKIEHEFIHCIPLLLLYFKNNIGFVGGKKNKAFYFVGVGNNSLLYLDPHLNQTALKDNFDNISSYEATTLYTLHIAKMSGALTLGIVINNEFDLIEFIKDAKILMKKNDKLIRIVP